MALTTLVKPPRTQDPKEATRFGQVVGENLNALRKMFGTNEVQNIVNVYSAYGTGTGKTLTTLSALLSDIGTSTKTICILDSGSWTITDDLDLSTYDNIDFVFLPGAIFSVSSGKTLTFPSAENIIAGQRQIFSGSGTVTFTNRGTIKAKWWGATGDGSTNDTATLNLPFAKSGIILVPYGTYLITGDTLVGASNQRIVFDDGAILKMDTTVSSKTLFAYSSKSEIIIENMTLDLNQSGAISNIGLKISACTNVNVINPRVINSAITRNWPTTVPYGYGIYLLSTWQNVRIENIYACDIMYPIITEASSGGNGLTVSGGRIEYISGDAVEINVPTGSATDIHVSGLTVYRAGDNSDARGIGFGASGGVGTTIKRVNVHDNEFIQCLLQGVHIEDGCESVNIHDNQFDQCGESSGASYGAAVYVAVTNATRLSRRIYVRGNQVVGGSSSDYGLYFGGSQQTDSVVVEGNEIAMAGAGAPLLFGGMTNFSLANNTVKNGGSGTAGISVRSSYGTVYGNRSYDDQGTKTQSYGMEWSNSAEYVTISENNLIGNDTGPYNVLSTPTDLRVLHNQGGWIETATGTFTCKPWGVTNINSGSGAVTATLGDGQYAGQQKLVVMTNSDNASTLSVTNHETSDPEVFAFDAVDDALKLEWTGTEWITIANSNVST